MPKIRIDFCFQSDKLNFDFITHQLGINPTRTRRREECPIPEFGATYWRLSTEKEETLVLDNQFKKILQLLIGKEHIINEIAQKYDAQTAFNVVIEAPSMGGPEVVLYPDVVSFASSINAEIGFDLYIGE
ncbi:DUF4279 domain-containing protein [uncultured Vagococcus sp.]|uniref:DUF4279 domain-containing protein n=1 Tax=uncultured Vagococcus sp. TaxID=189676 RepID=UPI0028D178FB|nr:DUF4279 domain-containing protein [uncultured Vagococcus sp.]